MKCINIFLTFLIGCNYIFSAENSEIIIGDQKASASLFEERCPLFFSDLDKMIFLYTDYKSLRSIYTVSHSGKNTIEALCKSNPTDIIMKVMQDKNFNEKISEYRKNYYFWYHFDNYETYFSKKELQFSLNAVHLITIFSQNMIDCMQENRHVDIYDTNREFLNERRKKDIIALHEKLISANYRNQRDFINKYCQTFFLRLNVIVMVRI